jgi:hypothetical protein
MVNNIRLARRTQAEMTISERQHTINSGKDHKSIRVDVSVNKNEIKI